MLCQILEPLGKKSKSLLDKNPTIDNSIDNNKNIIINTSETEVSHKKEIDKIIEKFKQISPSLNYGNKTERKACEEMIKRFSFQGVMSMTEKVLAAQLEDKYCPRATTPYKMWVKLGDYAIYFNKKAYGIPSIEE